ncbi:MAG: TIM44-like domain-containing protein [Methanobacterium sp.]
MLDSKINYFKLIIFSLVILLLPAEVFARSTQFNRLSIFGIEEFFAGKLVILAVILGAFCAIFAIGFVLWKYYQKNNDAKKLSKEIEKHDPAWNFNELEKHVIDTFYKIYEARTERNHNIMAGYTTPKLYNTYKSQIDSLIARNYHHSFGRIYLDKVKIMGINDYKDDNKDSFWAYIKGSAFSYYTHYHTGSIISGNSAKRTHFREMWKFVRTSRGWVLDRRDPYVIWSFLEAESFTEGYDNLDNGYLFCGDCEGYYALEEGESPEDFDVCQCGGSLTYYDGNEGLLKK